MYEKLRTMSFYERIILMQLFGRQIDRIVYGYDLRYAPARRLVERSLIPPKTKIPKVKFVDINGTLIQLEELDRRYRQVQLVHDFNEYLAVQINEAMKQLDESLPEEEQC